MDTAHLEFAARLAALTLDELDAIATAVEHSIATSTDWLARRQANEDADRAVRRHGRYVEAAAAAQAAVDAVLDAFERSPFGGADARATLVARAARDAAGALVVADVEAGAAAVLLRSFSVVPPVAPPVAPSPARELRAPAA